MMLEEVIAGLQFPEGPVAMADGLFRHLRGVGVHPIGANAWAADS